MKSKIGVSSFFGGSGSGIAEVGDGSGKDLSSTIWDYSSSGLELVETCKNEPPEAVLRCFKVFLSRPI